MTTATNMPKAIFWTVPVIALLAIAAAVIINWAEDSRAEVPVLGQVPRFSLTERSGKTITLDDLKGHLTVVDFIFTNCPSICPDYDREYGRALSTISDVGQGAFSLNLS